MSKRIWAVVGLVGTLAGCPRPQPIDPVLEQGTRSQYMDPRLEGRPVRLDAAPPPISGGTLLVERGVVIASDPDRDRIVVIDRVAGGAVAGIATLPPGAEPGRVIMDENGRAHAILRGAGEVFSFDPASPQTGERRRVCAMPRGIAYDASSDVLHVACRGGELVTLPAGGGATTRTVKIEGGDLRDVVMDGEHLYVTRFRAAELIEISAEGTVADMARPTSMQDTLSGSYDADGNFTYANFQPAVAWRAISMPSGGIAMVHQRASDTELQTAPGAYYTSSLCNGSIVQSAVTFFRDGAVSDAPNLMDSSLAIDVAVSDDGQRVAVVNAGNQSGIGSVVVHGRDELESTSYYGTGTCVYASGATAPSIANAIALDFASDGTLYVQQRQPSRLVAVGLDGSIVDTIDLGDPSVVADVFDTGHSIFHGNASRGTACASCHPEGGDDGRTWRFVSMGPRRTPAMHGDLTATAPFHWDGDLADLRELSTVVFTGRMSGPALTNGQVDSLGGWLDALPPPTAPRTMSDPSAARGQSLFQGEARCVSCHSGPMLTNNQTVDVGTGGAFQVPSLVGISSRLPVMHDGCAETLGARFRVDCGGGDQHGATEHLDETQVADLVAYLETL